MDPTAPGAEGSRGLAAEDYVTVELSDGEAPLFDAEPPSAASAPGEGLTWLAEEEVTTIELNRAALAEALAAARATPPPPPPVRSARGTETAALVLAAAAQILASAVPPVLPVPAPPAAGPRGSRVRRAGFLAATFAAGLGLGALFLGAWGGSFRGWLGRVAEVPFRLPPTSPPRAVAAVAAPSPAGPPRVEIPAPPAIGSAPSGIGAAASGIGAAASGIGAEPPPPWPSPAPDESPPVASLHHRHHKPPVVRIDELVLAVPDSPSP